MRLRADRFALDNSSGIVLDEPAGRVFTDDLGGRIAPLRQDRRAAVRSMRICCNKMDAIVLEKRLDTAQGCRSELPVTLMAVT